MVVCLLNFYKMSKFIKRGNELNPNGEIFYLILIIKYNKKNIISLLSTLRVSPNDMKNDYKLYKNCKIV